MTTTTAPLTELPSLESDYPLSPEQIAGYQRDGFILLRGVLSRGEMAAFRPVILEEVAKRSKDLKPMSERNEYGKMFVQIMHLWENNPSIAKFSLSRRLGKIVADLFQVDASRMYHDQALFKEPGGVPTTWHQDQWYIPMDSANVLTMWAPMVDVSEQMGTMQFAVGSHQRGMLRDEGISPDSEQFYEKIIKENGWTVFACGDMAPGDITFHAGWTVHRAPGNRTDRVREIMNIVYIADGSRIIAQGPWQAASGFHMKNRKVGDLVDSEINPVVYRRGQ